MTKDTVIGIDIGTQSIKIVAAEPIPGQAKPRIVYATESPSAGFRHGYVVDQDQANQSLQNALAKAERELGGKITQGRFSIGGVGLASQYVRTSIDIVSKHPEVTERHVEEVINKAEDLFTAKYPNKKILHIIPIKYSVDNRDVLGTPIGMYGQQLEIKIIFITILEHHYDAYITMLEKNNITPLDIIAAPLADATASLSPKQKTHGCMVTNVGADTTSSATFENGLVTSLEVLSIGSNDITNDIALGLQLPIEEAEDIKTGQNKEYPKRKVDEIVHARIADILELLEKYLTKIKKNRLLPAGVIFSGGGAEIAHIHDYAKQQLRIPANSVTIEKISKKTKRSVKLGSQFSTAYGLCFSEAGHQIFGKNLFSFKKLKKQINYWFNQIMP